MKIAVYILSAVVLAVAWFHIHHMPKEWGLTEGAMFFLGMVWAGWFRLIEVHDWSAKKSCD